jgi:hypothetical protein
MTVCPGTISGGVFTATSCADHTINVDLESDTKPTWSASVAGNHQIGLTNITATGVNPTTATRKLYNVNYAMGIYSTMATGASGYTIP